MDKDCKQCLFNSFDKLLNEKISNKKTKNALLDKIKNRITSLNSEILAPEVAREIHHLISKYLLTNDPYKAEKQLSNNIALRQYPDLKDMVLKSDNPFNTALRLSIAGNIMDFAACPEFFTDTVNYLNKTIDKVLNVTFAIDDSKELQKKLASSKTLLFIGDNAGEIVFDRLFLETINHKNVYFAIREKPVLNDATIDDANYTGINTVAKIISNGYDAPSTILEKSSDKFLNIFHSADLIISKGQGNLEGLINCERDNLYFLLMVKCNVIARLLEVKKGDIVVKKLLKQFIL